MKCQDRVGACMYASMPSRAHLHEYACADETSMHRKSLPCFLSSAAPPSAQVHPHQRFWSVGEYPLALWRQ